MFQHLYAYWKNEKPRGCHAPLNRARRGRRLAFESLETRKVMDAQGLISSGAEMGAFDLAAQVCVPPPGAGEDMAIDPLSNSLPRWSAAPPSPRVGVVYPLEGGDKFVWDGPHAGRLIAHDGQEKAFVEVEIVPNLYQIVSADIAGLLKTPISHGKTEIGRRFGDDGFRTSDYYILGVDQRLDANDSGSVNLQDAIEVLRHLGSIRDQAASPTDERSQSLDVNGDGLLSVTDAIPIIHYLRDRLAPVFDISTDLSHDEQSSRKEDPLSAMIQDLALVR